MKTKKMKLGLVSLGCEKNLVDSEMILGLFDKMDVEIITDLSESELLHISSCGQNYCSLIFKLKRS